ncbi:transposase [Bradyrhizobium huanghuaihaiense]
MLFRDDAAARAALEALRWPGGPRCPRCSAHRAEVFRIGGARSTATVKGSTSASRVVGSSRSQWAPCSSARRFR